MRALDLCYVLIVICSSCFMAFELPVSCKRDEYYEPSAMVCQACPVNASMASSKDGFACACVEQAVPVTPGRCRRCGDTALVSSDGSVCVPRRCQGTAGRTACRKCPVESISVTQNFEGSPMKEVLCVKCARGFKARNNACVRCASCACARNEVIVRDVCVPRAYVNARPKYEGALHPLALLDVVKYEYLCIQHDYRACRTLAAECVKNFYTNEAAGPCRLWLQPSLVPHKGLPALLLESGDMDAGIDVPRGKNTLKLALAIYTSDGGFKILQKSSDAISSCFSSIEISIGKDFACDCQYNISEYPLSDGDTLSLFQQKGDEIMPLPVALRKPNGYPVKRTTWPTDKFRRYFVMQNSLSTTSNTTITVYLRALSIQLRMERSKSSLRVRLSVEAQYATKPAYTRAVTTSLMVKHEMPNAGVLRGIEIWGGVLGALLSCYAVVQWRGVLRRGGLQASLLPLLAGSIADAVYFAAWFSTLHALAVEAGSFGLTLTPSKAEEHIIRAFVFSAVSLKVPGTLCIGINVALEKTTSNSLAEAIKAVWVNWNQCRCDLFFLDWSEYNAPSEDGFTEDNGLWKTRMLAQHWSAIQAQRRANPGVTVVFTIIILHLLTSWLASLPQSPGYLWAVGTIAWWSGYSTVLLVRWVKDRLMDPPTAAVSRICDGVGLSLMVFQEEYYAHYVHGRNNGSPDTKGMSGPLEACRVACAPQLRAVYKQLSTPGLGALDKKNSREALLSRFLAAFFERALDGLNWVASERTVLERLLDIELVEREAGNTSALLYDPNNSTPSCFAMAWWGEEWTLATLDAMLFGCILLTAGDWLMAALVTLGVWQVSKQMRTWFGDKNLKRRIGIETM